MRRVTKEEALALLELEHARVPPAARGCVMCALADPSFDAPLVVAHNDEALLRLNRIPSRPNELMVVLRTHKERVGELSERTFLRMYALAHAAATLLEREKGALRVFVAQLGAPDPILTSYPHLHVHVLPLYEGGEEARPSRVFSFSSAVYAYDPGEAEETASALRAGFTRMG